jgi:hypothetical protein
MALEDILKRQRQKVAKKKAVLLRAKRARAARIAKAKAVAAAKAKAAAAAKAKPAPKPAKKAAPKVEKPKPAPKKATAKKKPFRKKPLNGDTKWHITPPKIIEMTPEVIKESYSFADLRQIGYQLEVKGSSAIELAHEIHKAAKAILK